MDGLSQNLPAVHFDPSLDTDESAHHSTCLLGHQQRGGSHRGEERHVFATMRNAEGLVRTQRILELVLETLQGQTQPFRGSLAEAVDLHGRVPTKIRG